MGIIKEWNPLQTKLIELVTRQIQEPKETIKIFAHGGRGAGKSVAILFLVDLICQYTPGITCLVARRSFESIKLDTFNILDRSPGILDANKGKWTNSHRDYEYYNGSKISFRHMEKSDALFGPTYGLIYIEQIELCSEDDFNNLRNSLRQYSANSEYHKQYKEYVEKHQLFPARNYLFLAANPRANWVQSNIIKNPKTDFTLLSMPTKTNQDNLPADFINPNASDAQKRRMYDGIWESLAGLCYPEFGEKNVIDSEDKIELRYFNKATGKVDFSSLQNFIVLDAGVAVSKTAVMFGCVLPDNTLYIYDEICKNGKEANKEGLELVYIPEIAEEIKKKLNKYNIKDYYGLLDPAADSRNLGSPKSVTQQFRDEDIYFNPSRKTHEFDSIMAINSLFKQKKILINIRCASTLLELELFCWKVDKAGNPNKDQPQDKNNDFMDCLRYLVNAAPVADNIIPKKTSWTQEEIQQSYMEMLFKEEREVNPLRTIYRDEHSFGI